MDSEDSEEVWAQAHKEGLSHPLNTDMTMPRLAEKYTSGRRALEIGCGIGKMINPFHLAGYDIMGVEQCKFAVKVSHTRFPAHSFFLSRGQFLPFRERSFDVVYTNTCLQHNFHWRKLWVVQAIHYILKEDGLFLTQEDTGGGAGVHKRRWVDNPYCLTEKGYEALMLVGGFQLLEKVVINIKTEDSVMVWAKIHET